MGEFELSFYVPGYPEPSKAQFAKLRAALRAKGFTKPRLSWEWPNTRVTLGCRASSERVLARRTEAIGDVFEQVLGATPTIDDPVLGEFYWDANLSRWATEFTPRRREPFALFVEAASSTAKITRRLAKARRVLQEFPSFHELLKDGAADQLLDLYNETWNKGRRIGKAGFKKRMTIRSLSLHQDGGWSASFDDDDMFQGHFISVRVSSRNRIMADIVG